MSKQLAIAPGLSLPPEVVTEKLAFLGRTGTGKSYAAQKLAELMHEAGAQFIVLDPVGIWYGLRLAADGKTPGLPIPLLGGLRGDIPLEATAGAMVANLAVDRGASMILDVSQFESDADKARFAHAFADRFFFRKKASPSAVHLFVEEAQEFVPQNPQREEARMLHAFTRLEKLGRNFGVGMSLISQRPQEVNKKALNQTELLFAFQMTGPQERKTVEGWIAEKGIDEDIAGELPKLQRGSPHVWSPAWLQISKVVQISEKWTFDASSTPKLGSKVSARELSPIDLEKFRADMAVTIERAKETDPRELKRRIAELEKKLRDRPAESVETIVEKEVPVLKNGQLAKTEKLLERMEGLAEKMLAESAETRRLISPAFAAKSVKGVPVPPRLAPRQQPASRPSPQRPAARAEPDRNGDHKPPSRSQQKILDSLAWLESVGIADADKTQVALLAYQSPTSGGYFNNLGCLRTAGLIDYPVPGRVALTDAGRTQGNPQDVPETSQELQEQLYRRLSGSQAAILKALVEAYPEPLDKPDLAGKVGQSPTSGGYFNNLGRLRSLGLIEYPQPGRAVAAPVLFLAH